MADEIELAFGLPGMPEANLAAWRATPPPFLAAHDLEDQSYETLIYAARGTGAGLRILTWGRAKSLDRLVITFTDDTVGTRVVVRGRASEAVRDQIGAYLREHTQAL